MKGRYLSINGWHKDLEIIAPNGVQLKVDDVELLTVGDSVFERFRTLQKRVRQFNMAGLQVLGVQFSVM